MSRKLPSQPIKKVTWEEFDVAAKNLAWQIQRYIKNKRGGKKFAGIYEIPRGGYCLGVKLSYLLEIPLTHIYHNEDILIVDEIADEGHTLWFYTKNNFATVKTAVWHNRVNTKTEKYGIREPDFFVEEISTTTWYCYPWEE